MMNKVFISTLIVLFYTIKLTAQPWIPRLNKNGTHSLVTEKGKLVNDVAYDYITPLWEGEQYAYWQNKDQVGCLFPNKVSITFEPTKLASPRKEIRPVIVKSEKGARVVEEYVYLIDFSTFNLLVNIKTGKYIVDEINRRDMQARRMTISSVPMRNGLIKIHQKDNRVNFVDSNFNRLLPKPIKNGEMVHPNLFIAQDSISSNYGLIDANGATIAPYSYGQMYLTPNENHFVVWTALQKNTRNAKFKYGLLDLQGKLVLDTIYRELTFFSKDFYIIRKDDKSGVLNQFLKPVIPFVEYQRIEQIKNVYTGNDQYLLILNNNSKENLIVLDTMGNPVLKTSAKDFHINREYNYFDLEMPSKERAIYSFQTGIQLILKDTFDDYYFIKSKKDTFLITKKKGEVRFFAQNGTRLKTYPYDVVLPLTSINGYYIVIKDDKYGIIATSGDIIAPLKYDNIYDSRIEGQNIDITCFRTGQNKEYGIYDKKLQKWTMFNTESEAIKYLYPPEFKIITGANNQYGVVRQNGKPVIPAQYQSIQQIKDSPIFTCYDNTTQKWHVIGAKNNIIFTFEKSEGQPTPMAHILRGTGDYAIRTSGGTVFLEKDTYKVLSYLNLLFIEGICIYSKENNKGWITMFKPDNKIQLQNQIWVNYLTGKAYFEE